MSAPLYAIQSGQRVEFASEQHLYIAHGFQDPKDAGRLMYFCNDNGSTALVPVYNADGTYAYTSSQS